MDGNTRSFLLNWRRGLFLLTVALLTIAASMGDNASAAVRAPSPTQTSGLFQQGCSPFQIQGTTATGGAFAMAMPVTLDEMTDSSSRIVEGTVKAFRSCPSPDGRGIVTQVVLTPSSHLKTPSGMPAPKGDLMITVPGGEIGNLDLRVGSSPEFSVGEQVVVFLRESGGGALHLTEGFQSKFAVTPAGTVQSLGLGLGAFEARIDQAIGGALLQQADPLADGGIQITPQEFSTKAVWVPSDIPVPYYINPNTNRPGQLTAQDTRLATIEMFNEWQNVTSAYVGFRFAGDTTRVSGADGCGGSPSFDGYNDITWGIADPEHSSSTLAVTYMCYYTSPSYYFVDTDIEIDTDHYGSSWTVDPYSVNIDLPTVMLHENGHFLGLLHSDPTTGNCPVMKAHYTGLLRTLCSDDINGVRYLYSEGAGSTPATPTGLSASSAGSGTISVSWSNVSSELGYEVWRAPMPCAQALWSDFDLVDSTAANATTYSDDWYGPALAEIGRAHV